MCAAAEKPSRPTVIWNSTRSCSSLDRKSTRLNSSHQIISYAVFCLKKKKNFLGGVSHAVARSAMEIFQILQLLPWMCHLPYVYMMLELLVVVVQFLDMIDVAALQAI